MRFHPRRVLTGAIIVLGSALIPTIAYAAPFSGDLASAQPQVAGSVGTPALKSAWQTNYQTNFVSFDSCERRGYALVHYEPSTVGKIINWECHGPYGFDNRWAINVLWKT